MVGKKFLTDSRIIAQVGINRNVSQFRDLPVDEVEKRVESEMTYRFSQEVLKVFGKEITKTDNEDTYSTLYKLDLFVFSAPMFKLMIEYIISEYPTHEINRILNTKEK